MEAKVLSPRSIRFRQELVSCSDRIRAEQIRILYRTGPVGVVGAAVAAFVLAGLLQFAGSSAFLGTEVWLACLILVVAGHLAVCRRYWRATPADAAWRPWARWFTVFSAAEGTIWGVASMALTTPGQLDQHFLVLLVAATIASGAVAAYGSYLPAFYALLFPAIVPYGIASAGGHGPFDHAIAMLVPIYIVAIVALAERISANFLETLRLRFENLDLVQELRIQKEVAEQAIARKSSFLAAASHDLRQPFHALGMFVGALQGHAMNDEMRSLVEHIGSSVNAMDGLFNSLLDISRLDAGVVDTHINSFPIQPLLARVCRDHAAEARQRAAGGIAPLFGNCAHRSGPDRAHPSELVSNAVRYTDHGRVVVGCRRKTGSASRYGTPGAASLRKSEASVPGVLSAEQYRTRSCQGSRTGARDCRSARDAARLPPCAALRARKGVGVQDRYSARGQAASLGGAPPEAPESAMPRGLILVVDDEAAIQQAMQSLLSSWGHDVIVAGSCAGMLERIATCSVRPDLIVCDYRLRDGEDGIAVVERLRSEYNEDIPAVLITGDTAPDRLKDAQESSLVLLHKPVANSKLRAAIGNLMRAPGPATPGPRADSWDRALD